MSYPSSIDSYTTKINKNASGWYIPTEAFTIPASPYEIYLDHVPMSSATTSIPGYTEALVVPPGANKYVVDYVYGKLTFDVANVGAAVTASYYNLGDDIMAEHMNEVQSDIVDIETALGTLPAGASGTVRERLEGLEYASTASGIDGDHITDDTVRAGALMSDIKGAGWSGVGRPTLQDIVTHTSNGVGAHAATAISAIDPGTSSTNTVQDHIFNVGGGVVSTTNAHGILLSDIAYSDIDVQATYAINRVAVNILTASGIVSPTASGYVAGQTTFNTLGLEQLGYHSPLATSIYCKLLRLRLVRVPAQMEILFLPTVRVYRLSMVLS
jgi:hypothetical protein